LKGNLVKCSRLALLALALGVCIISSILYGVVGVVQYRKCSGWWDGDLHNPSYAVVLPEEAADCRSMVIRNFVVRGWLAPSAVFFLVYSILIWLVSPTNQIVYPSSLRIGFFGYMRVALLSLILGASIGFGVAARERYQECSLKTADEETRSTRERTHFCQDVNLRIDRNQAFICAGLAALLALLLSGGNALIARQDQNS
jgi:hypothetical protein